MDAAFWNQRYSGTAFVYGTEPNDFVAAMAPRISPGPVLCLGEGEGRNAVHLAAMGHQATAVDQAGVALDKARRLAASRGVTIAMEVADLADYRIAPGVWAAIIATWVHLPPALRRAVHAAAARGLRPGGVFILEAYTPAQMAHDTGGPKNVEILMTAEQLRGDLAGLQFEILREVEREVREGPVHTGRSAVVQVFARAHEPL